MTEQNKIPRPIQVFLDADKFISLKKPRQRGGNRDFFSGNNAGFARHKSKMRQHVRDASMTLRSERHEVGFVIVQMQAGALAKSYRPINALFSRSNSFCLVGGGGVGESYFQCTPNALDRLDHLIETQAEVEPLRKENRRTGELDLRPSTYRSELGGIENIRLPVAADRISFSAHDAVERLGQPNALGGYLLELFRPDTTADPVAVNLMVSGFRERLHHFGGIVALPLFGPDSTSIGRGQFMMSVQLISRVEKSFVSLPFGDSFPIDQEAVRSALRSDTQTVPISRHQRFLEMMANEPLLRRITISPLLQVSQLDQPKPTKRNVQPVQPSQSAPTVGIVDGGVADNMQILTLAKRNQIHG